MARTTTYYGLNISEGNDPVNPLVDIFPNFEDLDSDLKDVSDAAVGTATELTTGTVHALTRSDTDRDVFLFVATSNFEAGETFTLDGVQVTALTPDGQPLATGSYVIGSVVLCALQSTLLTVYVNPAKAKDSDKLDGQHGSYYATVSDVSDLGDTVTDISNKVGSAVLTTTAPDCSGAINELNTTLSALDGKFGFGSVVQKVDFAIVNNIFVIQYTISATSKWRMLLTNTYIAFQHTEDGGTTWVDFWVK